MLLDKTRFIYKGDEEACKKLMGDAKLLLYLLRDDVRFQKLQQYSRKLTLTDGSTIEAKYTFGREEVVISSSIKKEEGGLPMVYSLSMVDSFSMNDALNADTQQANIWYVATIGKTRTDNTLVPTKDFMNYFIRAAKVTVGTAVIQGAIPPVVDTTDSDAEVITSTSGWYQDFIGMVAWRWACKIETSQRVRYHHRHTRSMSILGVAYNTDYTLTEHFDEYKAYYCYEPPSEDPPGYVADLGDADEVVGAGSVQVGTDYSGVAYSFYASNSWSDTEAAVFVTKTQYDGTMYATLGPNSATTYSFVYNTNVETLGVVTTIYSGFGVSETGLRITPVQCDLYTDGKALATFKRDDSSKLTEWRDAVGYIVGSGGSSITVATYNDWCYTWSHVSQRYYHYISIGGSKICKPYTVVPLEYVGRLAYSIDSYALLIVDGWVRYIHPYWTEGWNPDIPDDWSPDSGLAWTTAY